MGRKPVTADVRRYLEKRSGVTVYAKDIEQELGFTLKQTQAAIYNLINVHHAPVLVVHQGRAWSWHPNIKPDVPPPPTSKPVYELIGPTRDNKLIIQGDDGALYRAEPL